MFKKVSRTRAFVCMLVMFALLAVWAFAEPALNNEAPAPEETTELATQPASEEEESEPETTSINFISGLKEIAASTGFASGTWQQYAMIAVACLLLYLAIVKQFEPLLLLPIAFGMLLANLPLGGLMDDPTYKYFATIEAAKQYAEPLGKDITLVSKQLFEVNGNYFTTLAEAVKNGYDVLASGEAAVYHEVYQVSSANGGLLYYLYQGVKLGIYPPLIFMGVGAMTDFAPLIANPVSLLLGAAAQLGIFVAFILARIFSFDAQQAASIGIIGGADGPTAIYVTTKLAPQLLGPIAVAAYSYMALVPVIQPPIMRALTTKKERMIVMEQLRPVSRRALVIFPILVTIIVSLLLPSAAPLVGMLMLGNLMRVSGVVDRISKTAQNELMNIVTIFLGLTVGATTKGETFLTWNTIKIVILGVIAFGGGTAGGVLLGKLMCKLTHGKINPLIGSAGVSAVPMAARVSQVVGQKENPGNFLLMHAMGPNVAGVIGSAVAAGVFIALFGA
ncbi:MAG TPA: sodium ion-translocating decarboxylase subunit beta [Candidatus Pullichristensenella excrementigallinarum]|uniref:Sodium ion-translocating decarboxylase subunit beta n=1 Tax=Candidatus Pullichristensenella excrementigallinarum TaxID=2840907 RepID=A0A9D1LA84_9FIRM|nr:sodium ion-translocating decarboxylase subunit beta [Candidatus Pullichristensenella excrementigallinarum]